MLNISEHLSKSNLHLKSVSVPAIFFSDVESFEAKLKLQQVQLESNITASFPSSARTKALETPAMISEHAGERAELLQAVVKRFQDMKTELWECIDRAAKQ